jgi:outer membrane biosynthesis protein TonB
MPVNRLNDSESRPAESLLVWAFAVSLAIHLLLLGTFRLGQNYKWWNKDLMPAWLKTTKQALAEIKKNQPAQPRVPQEAPLLFVDVSPEVSTVEPPKNAKYYSSRNSQAANPDPSLDTEQPKIDGTQTHVPKTETAPRAKPVPLQPAPPKDPSPDKEATEAKPKPKSGPAPGDLAMIKPTPKPIENQTETDPGQAEAPVHKRPRTLAEAKMQQALAGQKMKQDGGVRRQNLNFALNAIGTSFGEYDRQLVDAISSHWYDLLDKKEFSRDATGKVVIVFNLHYDGRVSDVRIESNEVGNILAYVCQSAIIDPGPYAPWPVDMRRMMGADIREIRFTFFYE